MKKHLLLCTTIVLVAAARVGAQDSYNDRAKKYVEQYKALALDEQKNSGIPASITLGQGILETEAGASELMTEANNHFGIKCNGKWNGPTFTHTDDAPDECFKKYTCAAESFHDHSAHLKNNPRYAPLFKLSTTDYAAWAVCLKKCGYATNPQYAQRLIKIIEDFKLQEYTYSAMDSNLAAGYELQPAAKAQDKPLVVEQSKAVATPVAATSPVAAPLSNATQQPPAAIADITTDTIKTIVQDTAVDAVVSDYSGEDTSKIEQVNGMKAFYAHKGEMLLGYAVKYNVRYPKLLEMNDLKDAPLPYDMYLYLERKMTTGTHATHEVMPGENMLLISQSEGIQLKRLAALNLLYPNEEPKTGTILQLQKQAEQRPDAAAAAITAHKENSIAMGDAAAEPRGDYIAINRPAPVEAEAAAPVESTAVETAAPTSEPAPVAVPVTAVPVRKMPAAKAAKKTVAAEPDLTNLKASLDKVVYADDSKLATATTKPAAQPRVEAAPKMQETSGPKYYTVKKGETAFSIAKRNNITLDQLYKWNDMDASGVKAGKSLRIKE